MEIEKKYFTAAEVCKILGVSYAVLWGTYTQFGIGHRSSPTSKIRFSKQDIEKLKQVI